MADKPYQRRVDEFLADYTDKFIPTLITGKGTKEAPFTNMSGPENPPMTKEQLDLEKTKILANSISPDIFSKVLDTMKGEKAIPSYSAFDPFRQRDEMAEATKMRKDTGVTYNPNKGPLTQPGGILGALGEAGWLGTRPGENPIKTNTTFSRPTGAGTLEEIMAAIPNELLKSHGAIDMTPNKEGVYEKAVPSLESMWGIKREGNTFTLPGGEGTMTAGPERFFLGGKEVPAGTPGAVNGDQLARERIFREAGGMAIPPSMIGESAIPMSRGPGIAGAPSYEMPSEVSAALASINKTLLNPQATWRNPLTGREEPMTSRMRDNLREHAEGLMRNTLGVNTLAKDIYGIQSESPYKQAMGDYYNRMAGVHEAAIPSEAFQRYATGMHALSEAERPQAFSPNSAVYKGTKLLGYVPEKPEAIHPIIRDVINKSMMVDSATGQQTGFDIRGARQKIGFMAPWLKAQGIDVPKESYKMTKGEFLAEQKSFVNRLPKKERSRYTSGYTEQLWKEYWGD